MTKILTKAQIKKIQKHFEQEKAKLIAKIYSPNRDEELDIDGDDVDIVQGAIISDLNNKISQRDIQALNKLNCSLEKIADGTFGACEECEAPIGERRLMAIPGCSICINCAEQGETNARQYA